MVGEDQFFEIHVATPLEVCEKRDTKQLYAKARKALADGKPMHFTGIDDPYEEPVNPELSVQGTGNPEEDARKIIQLLATRGFITLMRESRDFKESH